MSDRHLLIMAAGSGGHVIPGLAVAREMRQRGWSVSWLGTTHGIENQLVPPTGIAIDQIAFSGLRGKGWRHSLMGTLRLLAAFGRCFSILRKRQADVVLGMGGYVCFPGGLMAALLRRPLMLVNADAALLMSNRALLPVASRIAFGFAGPVNLQKSVLTGNPVRDEIEALPAPEARFLGRTGVLRLLVVGGSLGAKAINDCLPQALALIPPAQRPQVIHQTGVTQLDAVRQAYSDASVQAQVLSFIDDMAQQLADCDMMICRAGAVTVSELCAAGVASVLVPLVVSTTSHQRDNAMWLAGHGAALHLPQAELTPQHLAQLLTRMDRQHLLSMATQARALARPRAAARVADELEKLVS
jgi:UDP-N-acetylglucosamine--N-acetylmuramyl-(pentapeptide) pyrophosphoryl-undecaprenol N-acetylglucosamine transferase